MLGKECPNSEALGKRLHDAISNSKAKKYHGSSEHMNELPELKDQIKEYLYAEPSPFSHYDEATKKFLSGDDPAWKQLCIKKFDWVRRAIEQGIDKVTSQSLALYSDKNETSGAYERSLDKYIRDKHE